MKNLHNQSRKKILLFALFPVIYMLFGEQTCNIYLKIYVQSIRFPVPIDQHYNVEIVENYTLVEYTENWKHIRIDRKTNVIPPGNPFNLSTLGLQHIIFKRFHKASISRYGVASGDKFIQPCLKYWHFEERDPTNASLKVYRKIVCGFSFHVEYGHFLQDMVGGILTVPQEYINGADIFVNFRNESSAKDLFSFLGFDRDKIHILNREWVYGLDIYMANGYFSVNCLYIAWKELRNIVYKKYNLSQNKPIQNTFINKPIGNWGRILNMRELYNISKQLYPEYKWYYYENNDIAFNLSKLALVLSSTMLYVSAAGSSCFLDYFMQNNTAVLFLTRPNRDNPAFMTALHLNLWLYSIVSDLAVPQGILHYPVRFKEGLHDIMYVVKHHRWPKDVNDRDILYTNKEEAFGLGIEFFKNKTSNNLIIQGYSNFEDDSYTTVLKTRSTLLNYLYPPYS